MGCPGISVKGTTAVFVGQEAVERDLRRQNGGLSNEREVGGRLDAGSLETVGVAELLGDSRVRLEREARVDAASRGAAVVAKRELGVDDARRVKRAGIDAGVNVCARVGARSASCGSSM